MPDIIVRRERCGLRAMSLTRVLEHADNFYHLCFDIFQKFDFDKKVAVETHQVITTMETLNSTRQFFGPNARLFKIVEMCASKRPVSIYLFCLCVTPSRIHFWGYNFLFSVLHLDLFLNIYKYNFMFLIWCLDNVLSVSIIACVEYSE